MSKPVRQPWHPAIYDEADAGALKALAAGVANEGQQKRALKYIVETLAGAYEETFFADSERSTSYAQGKRHVGMQIVKLLKLPSGVFEREKIKAAQQSKPKRPNER